MAKARRSAKIRMGNGKPFHLDFTIMMCTNDLVFTSLFENTLTLKFKSRPHDYVSFAAVDHDYEQSNEP